MPSHRPVPNSVILAAAIGLGAIAGCSQESTPPESTEAESPAKAMEDKAATESGENGSASPIAITVTADKTHAV